MIDNTVYVIPMDDRIGINNKKIINILKNNTNKKIVIYLPEEYVFMNWQFTSQPIKKLVEIYIKKNKLKVEYWMANPEFDNVPSPIKGIKIVNWPTYTVHWTWHSLEHNTISSVENIDKLFISLNNKPHIHRCVLLDKIYQLKMEKYGNISWHGDRNFNSNMESRKSYKFKYFEEKTLLLDEFTENREQNRIPKQMFTSLFNIIAETHWLHIDITEKTYAAIICKKPFVLIGAPGINQRLKHFGFKLFDSHIDYSFEEISNQNDRTAAVLHEILKYKDCNYQELYNEMLPTIEHNYNRIIEIMNDESLIPNKFWNIYHGIKKLKTTYSPDICNKIYKQFR